MTLMGRASLLCSFLIVSTALLPTAFAQNLTGDARRIALGGAGETGNIATKVLDEHRSYRSIPIPLGLFQVLDNRKFFDPDDTEFDPVRAIEYAADPIHITLNRNSNSAGHRFVNNLVNGQISRDLNAYRGFAPVSEIKATGLLSPTWGKTFRVAGDPDVTSHGVYVGAGPYLSLGTTMNFDQNLIDLLASSTDVYRPNQSFVIGDNTTGQGAVAITGGYRGQFALEGVQGARLHVAANTSYLRGIHYDTADLQVRFGTDSVGLVTIDPFITPISVDRSTSKSGNGVSVDVATAVVADNWSAGFGVDGIGNRINWKELQKRQYFMQSLFTGGDFVSTPSQETTETRRVTLPVRYTANGGYHTDRWGAAAEWSRGLNRAAFGGGMEYWLGPLALRGGSRYSRGLWHGSSGIGFDFTDGFGVDVAAFQTSTNIEEDRRISFAVSLRLTRTGP
jgi:hypothetical protein